MSEPFYVAAAEIRRIAGVHRRASLQTGEQVDFGVHGAIRAHYRLEGAPDMPLPVDYIAAAVGT